MRVTAFIKRDLLKFSRNPMMILASVLLPLLYLVIIGNTFQGQLKNLPVAIVDQDSGHYSKRVVDMLRAICIGTNEIEITFMSDPKRAQDMVRNGFFKAALIIPNDFSRDVITGDSPNMGLFLDNTDSVSSNAISVLVREAIAYLKREYIAIRARPAEIQIRAVNLYRKVDYDASLVPGAIVMAIFMGTMITGVFNLVMDKFLGVHESYLSTPLTKADIVIGTIVSGVFVTAIISIIVLAGGMLITGMGMSGGFVSFLMLVFVILLSSLGLLSMMFIILGRANHPRVVGLVTGFLNVIFYFPSGAVYPIESFPGWLKAFAKVNPEAYIVHALKCLILKGSGIVAIKGDIVFLSVFTIIALIIATFTFKRTF